MPNVQQDRQRQSHRWSKSSCLSSSHLHNQSSTYHVNKRFHPNHMVLGSEVVVLRNQAHPASPAHAKLDQTKDRNLLSQDEYVRGLSSEQALKSLCVLKVRTSGSFHLLAREISRHSLGPSSDPSYVVQEFEMPGQTAQHQQLPALSLKEGCLTRLSTFASTANFFRGVTPRDGVVCRESSRIASRNAV